MDTFSIGGKSIGKAYPTFIIAEIGQNHDGSLGLAHSYIDAAAKAGADAVKFQTHLADKESTREDKFRINFSYQDKTRYEYWKRMEFSREQWAGLKRHADSLGLIFLSSAFSIEALELLQAIEMPAWKVGSGEFKSFGLLEAMKATKKPILFSTGMSLWSEISQIHRNFRADHQQHAILQCTSKYPTPLEEVGINVLEKLRASFDCPIGLSDHSGTIFPSLLSLGQDYDIIEVHLTFHKGMFGPDVAASVSIDELTTICEARDAFSILKSNAVDKDEMASKLDETRILFTKSLAPTRKIKAGEVLSMEMLTTKKPGTGLGPEKASELLGQIATRDIMPDELISFDDFEKGKNKS